MCSVTRCIKVVFQNLLLRGPFFSVMLRRGRFELGCTQAYVLFAEKDISVVSHMFRFINHVSDTEGTVTITTRLPTSPWPPRS